MACIYEVRNTDTDMSHYVFPLTGTPPYRHGAPKDFYVSPFISAKQDYAFTLDDPGEDLALRIRLDGADGLTMIAAENGERTALTDPARLRHDALHDHQGNRGHLLGSPAPAAQGRGFLPAPRKQRTVYRRTLKECHHDLTHSLRGQNSKTVSKWHLPRIIE
jgi:hypothetical protein